jgi:ABC-type Fe3+-hydroxamate transport system substrate-binding protein
MNDSLPSPHSQALYDFVSPVASPPRTVVSLVPCLTESLFDLKLGDRLVAVTNGCIHPADQLADLPRLGHPMTPDIDRIRALQPDLVLLNTDVNPPAVADQLQAAGIAIWITDTPTVLDAINALWQIMYIFDAPEMSERVRWIERQMDWTNGASANESVRVFAPIWYDPWVTASGHAYAHDLLRICGGDNVFGGQGGDRDASGTSGDRAHGKRYPQVTLDAVEVAQPQAILVPYQFDARAVQQLASLDVPAVRSGRIRRLDGTLLTWAGTRLAYALAEIPPLLALSEEDHLD